MLTISIIMNVILGIYILLFSVAFLDTISFFGASVKDLCIYFGGIGSVAFIIVGTWLLYCRIPA